MRNKLTLGALTLTLALVGCSGPQIVEKVSGVVTKEKYSPPGGLITAQHSMQIEILGGPDSGEILTISEYGYDANIQDLKYDVGTKVKLGRTEDNKYIIF